MELFEVVDNALREFTKIYAIKGIEGYDALSFLQGARQNLTTVLRNNRKTKVKLLFRCNLEFEIDYEWVVKKHAFHTTIKINLEGTDENDLFDTMAEEVIEAIASFQAKKTDSRFHSLIQLELRTAEYKPLRGETYIPLSKELAVKTAIINIKNNDNKCFLWCVLRALSPKDDHPEREDKELKLKENTLNMGGGGNRVSCEFDRFKQV